MTRSGISVRISEETSLSELLVKIKACKHAINRHIRSKGFREPEEHEVEVTIHSDPEENQIVFKFVYRFDEEDKDLLISNDERGI